MDKKTLSERWKDKIPKMKDVVRKTLDDYIKRARGN